MADQRVYALFQNVADAERAIGALEDHGVPRANVGVAARRAAESDQIGHVRTDYVRTTDDQDRHQGEPVVAYEAQPGALPAAALADTVTPNSGVDTAQNVETVGKDGLTTTTPQDAAAGAAVGTGVGLVAGLLAAAAALTIPGVGLILAGGALASAIGVTLGTTAAGAAVGGVVGYLRDMGMPEQAASRYADRLNEGDYLVTALIASEQYDDVKKLLLKYNATGVDINVTAAGQNIPTAVATDPVIATEMRQPLDYSPTAAEAAGAGDFSPVGARIITEDADGRPLIPARVVGE